MSEPSLFFVWRCQHSGGAWTKTAHCALARSRKEAQYKFRRRFINAGFSAMSLLAVEDGVDPNKSPATREHGA